MDAEAIKRLIRKGQSDEVIFAECPTSSFDIAIEIQKLIHFKKGTLIIGVKSCGTVVGLKNKEAQVREILAPLLETSSLIAETVQLIRYYTVLVVYHPENLVSSN